MAVDRVRRVGAYAPLSTSYYKDDDIAEAGEAAELLFVRGLAFCAEMLHQDGYISATQVLRYVGVGMTDAKDRAERLADVGLWERVDGGYVVRSWLKWNKSSTEIGRAKAADRDRKAAKSSARNPSGSRAESETTPNGIRSTEALQSTTQHTTAEVGTSEGDGPPSAPPVQAKNREEKREDVERLCEHLAARIEANGSKRPTINQRWRDAARLMLDNDGRTEDQIRKAIDWSQDDPFWRAHILAMPKLREKYEALRLRAAGSPANGKPVPARKINPRDQWKYDV